MLPLLLLLLLLLGRQSAADSRGCGRRRTCGVDVDSLAPSAGREEANDKRANALLEQERELGQLDKELAMVRESSLDELEAERARHLRDANEEGWRLRVGEQADVLEHHVRIGGRRSHGAQTASAAVRRIAVGCGERRRGGVGRCW